MMIDLELAPKTKRRVGERCCEPVVYPDVEREHALRMAEVAKALGDPIRLQLVDVLRKHAGEGVRVRACAAVRRLPADALPPPRQAPAAGIVDSERRGLWAYYYVIPGALEELSGWLS